jgi:hypothetical protein
MNMTSFSMEFFNNGVYFSHYCFEVSFKRKEVLFAKNNLIKMAAWVQIARGNTLFLWARNSLPLPCWSLFLSFILTTVLFMPCDGRKKSPRTCNHIFSSTRDCSAFIVCCPLSCPAYISHLLVPYRFNRRGL